MTSARRARGARFFTLGALLMLGASSAGAQQPQRSSPTQASITVQGHWTFEVRNADGSGVKRYEFDNALVSAKALLTTLARQNSAGRWNVILGDYEGVDVCANGTPPVRVACALQEPGDQVTFSDTKKFAALSVSLEGSPSPTTLVLQGTFTADLSGQITAVRTGLALCANTVAPASPCANGSGPIFTAHTMQPSAPPSAGGPIPVAAGQIVQVRVEIRFSSSSSS